MDLDKKMQKSDDKFTSSSVIEYPSENDNVDVKILNTNIKILDEKKADDATIKENLKDVAKESSPKNIENMVNDINERVKILENNTYKDLLSLPNRHGLQIYEQYNIPKGERKEYFSVTGSGHLVAFEIYLPTYYEEESHKMFKDSRVEVEVDGKNIYNLHLNGVKTDYITCGIINPHLCVNIDSSYGHWGFPFPCKYAGTGFGDNSWTNYVMQRYVGNIIGRLPQRQLSEESIELNSSYSLVSQTNPDVYIDKFIRFNKSLKIFFTAKEPNRSDSIRINLYYSLDNK